MTKQTSSTSTKQCHFPIQFQLSPIHPIYWSSECLSNYQQNPSLQIFHHQHYSTLNDNQRKKNTPTFAAAIFFFHYIPFSMPSMCCLYTIRTVVCLAKHLPNSCLSTSGENQVTRWCCQTASTHPKTARKECSNKHFWICSRFKWYALVSAKTIGGINALLAVCNSVFGGI